MTAAIHEGKEVTKIAGSAVYGARCVIYYADGSSQKSEGYNVYDTLIQDLGFVTYKSMEHDRYFGGESFEAVPPNDASEWEEFDQRKNMGGQSGWRRKGMVEGAGAFLNGT